MPTPLGRSIQDYSQKSILRLHMPGHIGGKELLPPLREAAPYDLTEIPGLDDLHQPQAGIKQAKEYIASCFGAEESFILVNGASSGIHALMLAAGSVGDKILLPRNVHRSFYGALVMSGADPLYMPCTINSSLGMAVSLYPSTVEDYLNRYADIQAVFITSPSYFGTCAQVEQIAALVHKRDIPLMVDEAHGAHFSFHSAYPRPALEQGADAAVNGLHKTLPVLTPGAVLHMASSFPAPETLRAAWSLLTTTSPSYLLMASIEWGVAYMETQGQALLEQARELSCEYQKKISQIPGLQCMGEEFIQEESIQAVDPLKVVVAIWEWSLNGQQLDALLRSRYGIQVEMAENNFILAMFSLLHKREDWEMFYQALLDLSRSYYRPGRGKKLVENPPLPQVIFNPRQAFFANKERVGLKEARGRIAGELVAAYPPGIPCVLPGEQMNAGVIDYLEYVQKSGVRIQGPADPTLQTIQVIS
ncbi:MAG TPA: aminotransferase class I/II-fold pyridoxal phosphate-dependent enzyme [Syntrophomonadaceae bacterium]|nr:aminotransferase class I/II-fold pyridoxal phosphate-dependent enzyme [Syntrophomonadaceae bacterium]